MGASHTIMDETIYHLLRERGTVFETAIMKVALDDGILQETEVSKAQVLIKIEDRCSL